MTGSKESFNYIPFASQVTFELLYSAPCVADSSLWVNAGEDCFGVSVRFNGEPMELPGCTGDGFSEDGTGCTYSEFKQSMDSIWYSGPDADDLDKACS